MRSCDAIDGDVGNTRARRKRRPRTANGRGNYLRHWGLEFTLHAAAPPTGNPCPRSHPRPGRTRRDAVFGRLRCRRAANRPAKLGEPGVVPEVSLGKRCARLDLRSSADRAIWLELLRGADVLVHGFRADALENLGLDARTRRDIRPGLVDVSLNAYGWSGPWRNRRGFDSLVQMSAGIADSGMTLLGKDRPAPLPVQALDHATGYLMAAAVVCGLTQRIGTGRGFEARASLARTAHLLVSEPVGPATGRLTRAEDDDWSESIEATHFGPARRLRPPLTIGDAPMHWDRPAVQLGSSAPAW